MYWLRKFYIRSNVFYLFSTDSVITKAFFIFSNRNCTTAQEDCRSTFSCQRQGTGQKDRYDKYGSLLSLPGKKIL